MPCDLQRIGGSPSRASCLRQALGATHVKIPFGARHSCIEKSDFPVLRTLIGTSIDRLSHDARWQPSPIAAHVPRKSACLHIDYKHARGKRRDILNLHLQDYQEWSERVEEGFRKAAAFLQSQFVFRRQNVPYNAQLVPLAALYVELGGELEPALAREKLAHWYWSGIFGEAYGGNTAYSPYCRFPLPNYRP